MIVGIILAAGRGKRYGSSGHNKTAELLAGKPLIKYGIDLFTGIVDKTVVVVGAYAKSVKDAVGSNPDVAYALQRRRLGTGHALKTALREIVRRGWKPELVLLGYGDHLMGYKKETVCKLIQTTKGSNCAGAIVSTEYPDPNSLAWGRILSNDAGEVMGIVEQKDATEEQRKLTRVNPGFYCFNFDFAMRAVKMIKKSPVSGEYYATDLVGLAVEENKTIRTITVPFSETRSGVNTKEDLKKIESLMCG